MSTSQPPVGDEHTLTLEVPRPLAPPRAPASTEQVLSERPKLGASAPKPNLLHPNQLFNKTLGSSVCTRKLEALQI